VYFSKISSKLPGRLDATQSSRILSGEPFTKTLNC